jgi:hypothetical protein
VGNSPIQGKTKKNALFIIDEAQKIDGWSETVKRLWDEDTVRNNPIHVMLLSSSLLLVQCGLTESLAGRFEIIPVTHWSYGEMQKAFGWGLTEYISTMHNLSKIKFRFDFYHNNPLILVLAVYFCPISCLVLVCGLGFNLVCYPYQPSYNIIFQD